jgi:L-asparaginase
MSLRIIATGGTFDKHYDEIAGRLDFAGSHLPQAIERARITLPLALQTLALRDSLDMNDADRAAVLIACESASEAQIVIIHGTDTMHETAAVLAGARLAKTVVLTGAMVPYEFMHSDALFNFGFACCAAQTLTQGVYIAMNGRVFSWDNVRKNRAIGAFELP